VLQPLDHPLGIVQQVRDEHHEAALSDGLHEIAERLGHVRLLAEFQPLQRDEHGLQVAGARAGRQHVADAVVEREQADGVSLTVHQVRQCPGQVRRVLELGHLMRAVAHRAAHVEQDVALEVGLFLELLDDVPVRARIDFPVERREVVAREVLPVLGELDAEPLERAAMQSRQESFDDGSRLQVDGAQSGDNRRVEIVCLPGHGVTIRWRAGARFRAADR
jgi:hypothetical protein